MYLPQSHHYLSIQDLYRASLQERDRDINMLAAQILTHTFTQPIDTGTRRDATIQKVHDAAGKYQYLFLQRPLIRADSQVHSKNVWKLASLNPVSSIVFLQQFLQLLNCK